MNSSRSKLELLMIKYFEKNLITFFRHVLTNKASQKRPPPPTQQLLSERKCHFHLFF